MRNKATKLLQKVRVDRLPTLPHVLLHLLDICHDDTVSYQNFADILRMDPALYIKVISAYSHNGQVNTNQQPEATLEQLGVNTIKSIAITSAVQQFFSRNNHERTEFIKQHWYHSLLCATVAESIANLIHYKHPAEAYTAGLLHDIGQLVLEDAHPSKYTGAFAQLSEDKYFHDLESEEFGTTHQHVGAELLKRHGNNPFLSDAILYHHEAAENILDAHPLVKITNLANQLTSAHFEEADKQVFEAAEALFGLAKPLLMETLEKSRERIARIAQGLELNIVTDGVNGETAKQIVATDQYKQIQLAEQIRNIAMLDGVHQHLSRLDGESSLINAVEQHIDMLFGVNNSVLFRCENNGKKVVRAISSGQYSSHLDDLTIPLEPSRSLITEALLEKQTVHSFDEAHFNLTVVDQELLALLGHEGLLCVPMIINDEAFGTLVLGIDEGQKTSLRKQLALLTRFANEVAQTLAACRKPETSTAGSDVEEIQILESRIHEVIHEVRNPLSIMNNYVEILSFKLNSDDQAQSDIQTIKSEIERVGSILKRLSEPEAEIEEAAALNINQLIVDMTHMFQTSLFETKNIKVELELDERLPVLISHRDAIKQIYTNLVKNSVEALPANGKVMVYTHDQVIVDGQEYFEIAVRDNGPGIDSTVLPNLFSPVSSTKGTEHAGLGLSIIKNLVGNLHGTISCRSSDKGTSFHVLLPKKMN